MIKTKCKEIAKLILQKISSSLNCLKATTISFKKKSHMPPPIMYVLSLNISLFPCNAKSKQSDQHWKTHTRTSGLDLGIVTSSLKCNYGINNSTVFLH